MPPTANRATAPPTVGGESALPRLPSLGFLIEWPYLTTKTAGARRPRPLVRFARPRRYGSRQRAKAVMVASAPVLFLAW
jgi:hypothetical protein